MGRRGQWVWVGVGAVVCGGCEPKTITHQPPIKATVTVSPTVGMPGVILFGETEGEVRRRFGQRLYVDEDDGSSEAYDDVYALVNYNDNRQVDRLVFDFDKLRQHGVNLTVRITHNGQTITVDRTTTPQQFEYSAGCRDRIKPGTRLRREEHTLLPRSPDRPCSIIRSNDNNDTHSDYTIANSYTLAAFAYGHLQRLYVFDTSLKPKSE